MLVKKIKKIVNLNLIWTEFNPIYWPDSIRSEYISDRIGSGYKFGLCSDEFVFNPINLKFDRVDPNPTQTRICPPLLCREWEMTLM